jgi:DNA-binding transcriptional regulator YdaS (Cro superfamily)
MSTGNAMGKAAPVIPPEVTEGLTLAKAAAGSEAALASFLGLNRSAVHRWIRVPIDHVREIEAQYGVPRAKLRPDIFNEGE